MAIQIESAMKNLRLALLTAVLLLGLLYVASFAQGEEFVTVANVAYLPPAHSGDIAAYELSFGRGCCTALITVDSDAPLAKVLKNAKRIRLTIEPIPERKLEKVER